MYAIRVPRGRTGRLMVRYVVPRTELTYPAHTLKMHQNAADPVKSPVDLVMADFEDACPPEFKGDPVRQTTVEAFNTIDYSGKVVAVRPNNMESNYFEGDMGSHNGGCSG